MRKATYLGVFEPTVAGGYSVYFPDLPGCISAGNTMEEAQMQATDALGLHFYGMEKDGEQIPEPSSNPEIDPETESGYFISPVTIFPDMVAIELDNRAVKTNLTIPAWLKEMAEAKHINFSRVLQAALIEILGTPARVAIKQAGTNSETGMNVVTEVNMAYTTRRTTKKRATE